MTFPAPTARRFHRRWRWYRRGHRRHIILGVFFLFPALLMLAITAI